MAAFRDHHIDDVTFIFDYRIYSRINHLSLLQAWVNVWFTTYFRNLSFKMGPFGKARRTQWCESLQLNQPVHVHWLDGLPWKVGWVDFKCHLNMSQKLCLFGIIYIFFTMHLLLRINFITHNKTKLPFHRILVL